MVECWLIRHAQTDWNVEGRYQGQADMPLNATGLAQANMAVEKLAGFHFDALYSSDLLRARQTAQAISMKLGLKVSLDTRLREINLGEWQGQLFTEIREKYPTEMSVRRADPENSRPPGGETVKELSIRVWAAFDEISHANPGGSVLVVSHGLALAAVIARTSGTDLKQIFKLIPENADPMVVSWASNGSQI
jgi:probable phosphoglycerate mutase